MTHFPFDTTQPVQFTAPLPPSAEVVVIGGGVIGVMTALFLNRAGVKVVLLEKGRVAAEQSSRNWGWVRQQGRDYAEMPISVESRRLWQQLAAESGEDFGLTEGGVSYLARTEAQMKRFEDTIALATDLGVGTRLLSSREVADMFPAASATFAGGAHTASDFRAEPWLAVPAIARMAVREGVVIIENCAARGLDISAGRISGVITEKGRIVASSVLVAGGAWSSLLLRRHGVIIPQLNVRGTVAATMPLPEICRGAAGAGDVAFRRRQDGGYTLATGERIQIYVSPDSFRHLKHWMTPLLQKPFGQQIKPLPPKDYPEAWGTVRKWSMEEETPFERMRVLNPEPEQKSIDDITHAFGKLFPSLGPIKLKKTWAGMIDAMPDYVPVIDNAPSIPGLFIGTGMSAHGFGIGPGFGRVIADMIQGNEPGHNMSRFRFNRFTDGSPIKPGPAL